MSLDRLSTLFQHAQFNVTNLDPTHGTPALDIQQLDTQTIHVCYFRETKNQTLSASAVGLDFGGPQSALYQAIPETLSMTLHPSSNAWAMAQTILLETKSPRCGSPIMLNRLIEVVLIYLLRDAIEQGTHIPGMLLGLADNHLKFALVAVHDKPGHPWTVDELALLSGVSRTLFYKRFNKLVGCSPLHYLRQWRMTLARGHLIKGKRITQVARDIGYRSNEGFSRAFHQHFGEWPSEIKNETADSL